MSNIDEAFRVVDRRHFVPDDFISHVDRDVPLPLGFGQTISQPTTVRMMLEWLEPEPGNKILDIGSGSGWTTALLAHIVGTKGQVYAVERIPELVKFGKNNNQRLGTKNVHFFKAGKGYGLPKYAPYDRILVSASAQILPTELIDQLKVGGKLVIPVRNDILEITKTGKKDYETAVHPGFVFVPLVGN